MLRFWLEEQTTANLNDLPIIIRKKTVIQLLNPNPKQATALFFLI
jgi:hypothetical protein